MGQEAELNVKSDSVKQLTTAVDALVASLEKLAGSSTKAEKRTKKAGERIKKVGKTTKKTEKETDKFQTSLKKMGDSAQLITGPLGGVASRIAVIGRVAKTGQIAMVALSVAATLIVKGLLAAGKAADKANLLLGSLNAQVRATGQVAGFTGQELDEFARRLAFATLDSHEGVVKLAQTMLTFRSVSGDAFTTAIELSQDLGLAMSQDPVTAAKALGRALNNPLQNYKQLKRIGIEFNDTQIKRLQILQSENDLVAQQKIITDEVAKSVDGVAKAQADSLAGDKDTFSQRWDLLAETIGNKSLPAMRAATQAASDFLNVLQELQETDLQTAARVVAESGKFRNKNASELAVILENQKEQLYEQLDVLQVQKALLENILENGTAVQAGQQRVLIQQQEKTLSLLDQEHQATIRLLDLKESITPSNVKTPPGLLKLKEEAAITLEHQKNLNTILRETGDIRSKEFRQAQVLFKINKTFRDQNFEGNEKDKKILIERGEQISKEINDRVTLNSVIQIQKGIENNTRGLENRIKLQEILNRGYAKNSLVFQDSVAILTAKDKLLKANIVLESEEGKAILELTRQNSKYKQVLEDISALKNIGLTAANGYRIASSDIQSIRLDLLEKIKVINASEILSEKAKIAALIEIRKRAAEEESAVLGVDVRIESGPDGKSIETVIGELQANEEAKNLALTELRTFFQENDLLQHEEYLRRKNEITQEYESNATEITKNNHEATQSHINSIRQQALANQISSIASEISAAKGGNKKLARIAKLASIFAASTALVDSLSAASKVEPYYAKFAAYAEAAVSGAKLVSLAGQLSEPSFAHGGVDIRGKGTGTSDSINARISNGESVITQSATAKHKSLLRRINAGLPLSGGVGGVGGRSISFSPSIIIQGDASSETILAIDERLSQFEDRVVELARGASLEVINEEQEVGGSFNPI